MFALGIDFLNGWMMAKHPSSHDEPEWPPHPARVFMALAAAHFETGADHDERVALEWLEKLEEPVIHASVYTTRKLVKSYVPVNDEAKPYGGKKGQEKNYPVMGSLPIGRNRKPRTFPVAIPEDTRVFFVWENADIPSPVKQALQQLCTKVTYVGHSASLVQMWIESSEVKTTNGIRTLVPASHEWRPLKVRMFTKGFLHNLERCYNQDGIEEFNRLKEEEKAAKKARKKEIKHILKEKFSEKPPVPLRPMSSIWCSYTEKKFPDVKPDVPSSLFDHNVLILRKIDGRPLGLVSTLQLTHAFRKTLLSLANDPIPEWLHGHEATSKKPLQEDHLAIVPLPFVGHLHADGHIMGVGMILPRSLPEETIAKTLYHILFTETGVSKTISIILDRLSTRWQVELEQRPDYQRSVSLRDDAITKASHRWGTVTPIALDRHAKGKDKWSHVEESIRKACKRIGLPEPVSVNPMPVSCHVGSPHSRSFPRLVRKNDQGKIFHTHAKIEFPVPVQGPVLLGAGRYRGYGMCYPLKEDECQ